MDLKEVTKQRGLDVPLKGYSFEYGPGTYVNAICR